MNKLFSIIFLSVISLSALAQEVKLSHNLPATLNVGQTYDAEFTVAKSNIGSFAKFQCELPPGFNAENIDSKTGNFTFENNRAKIVWVSIPADATFSFKIKLTCPQTPLHTCVIGAKFYYLENNVKKEFEMDPHNMSISHPGDGSTPVTTTPATVTTTAKYVPPPTEEPKPAETTPVTTTPAETTPVETTPVTTTPVETTPVETTPVETAPVETTPVTTTPVETTPVVTAPVEPKYVPPVTTAKTVTGKTYRVQVGAFSVRPDKSKLSQYGNVQVVEEGGMFKAVMGKYSTLEDAERYKGELLSKGIQGFVVAYLNGSRVSVRD